MNSRLILLLLTLLSAFVLSACDLNLESPTSKNSSKNVQISSNAVLFATRDGDKDWRVDVSGNTLFNPNFVSLLANDKSRSYEAMFVCPSSKLDTPHKVYFYMATVAELGDIRHQCRKAESTILLGGVYGEVSGVSLNSGEKVWMALGANSGTLAYEAYAFEDVDGLYDILGIVGLEQEDGTIQPKRFHKFELIRLARPPARRDLDFSENQQAGLAAPVGVATPASLSVQGLTFGQGTGLSVSFRSELNSTLLLAKSNTNNLQYYGFPLDVMYSDSREYEKKKEGHVAKAWQQDSQGRITREVVQLFKKTKSLDMNIAQAEISQPAATTLIDPEGTTLSASWTKTTDGVYGDANLYYWIFKGKTSNSVPCPSCGGIQVSKVEWHVLVTPGWVKAKGKGDGFLLEPVVGLTNKWFPGWNFAAGTALDAWEVRAYYSSINRDIVSQSSSTGPEAVLKFLFNREFVDGLLYSHTVTYSQ
ncbi:MAG: hypothetical protein OEZ43_01595 [Gammaproteobacteria bacterium]|nr:hypothetical protein [Gammaproteobacteria bacterium]